MSADKKQDREKMPHPEKETKKHRNHEEERKGSAQQHKPKQKKVNYVIKDLPIY